MDLHRLQTDEEAYFAQSVIPPVMDIHHARTGKEACLSQSSIPLVMMDLHLLHSEQDASRLQTDEEAHLPESSMPPLMDLHRLQTDEEVHFSGYVASPACDSNIPSAARMTMTSPFPMYAVNPPAYRSNTPSAMTMSPVVTSSSSPPEDACMVLSLSSLLQSSGAGANPSSLPARHATFSSISEPISSSPVLSTSTKPSASTPQPKENKTDFVDNAFMQLDTLSYKDTLAESEASVVPTLKPTLPGGVNACTEVRQSQVITPCATQGRTAHEIQDMTLGKNRRRGKGCSNEGLVPKEGPTTLMIRGIPCSITEEELMALMDNADLKGKYDFFYLPTDKRKSTGNKVANLGYAFVNFVDQQSAEHCATTFRGVPLAPSRSLKKCAISPADIQGIPRLWQQFKRAAVSHGGNGPRFLML
jgi:hypothetical protein